MANKATSATRTTEVASARFVGVTSDGPG
jgi:hypothetical protein